MNSVFFHKFKRMDLYNTANLTKIRGIQRRTRGSVPGDRPGLTGVQTGIAADIDRSPGTCSAVFAGTFRPSVRSSGGAVPRSV